MTASTRSISLVLLGSALFLAGCQNENEDPNNEENQATQPGGGGHRGGMFIPIPIGGMRPGGGGVGGVAPSVGGSVRGGFGGSSGGISAAG